MWCWFAELLLYFWKMEHHPSQTQHLGDEMEYIVWWSCSPDGCWCLLWVALRVRSDVGGVLWYLWSHLILMFVVDWITVYGGKGTLVSVVCDWWGNTVLYAWQLYSGWLMWPNYLLNFGCFNNINSNKGRVDQKMFMKFFLLNFYRLAIHLLMFTFLRIHSVCPYTSYKS